MRSASDLWGYRPFSVTIDKTVFLAVQCAYAQGDQIQALRHFHGYPLDYFPSR